MRKLILIVHTSLDGFVAGKNGELNGFEAGEENLQFVCSLTEEADTALFGRISYQLLQTHWPTAKDRPGATKGEVSYSTWYSNAKKIVISNTLLGKSLMNTTILSGDISNEMIKIKKQAGRNILIFGSPSVAQSLMRSELIDEYWVFVNPAIFGEGIPLWKDMKKTIRLQMGATKQFSNGELAMHYTVNRP